MGILTSLVKLSQEQEDKRRDSEMNLWSTLAQNPEVRPELRNRAIDEILKLGPRKGGLSGLGDLFKGIIGKHTGDGGAQQRFGDALASTGRPETTLNAPGAGSQVPGSTIGGGQSGPTIGGQEVPAPPQVPGRAPQNLSEILPGGQQQKIGPVAPSALLSPQEQLGIKLDQVRAEQEVRNDLAKQLETFKNEEATKAQLDLDKKRFQAQRENVDALVQGGYSRDEAVGFVTGRYPPAEKVRATTRPIQGSDPRLAARGADPKKFYTVYEDPLTGNVLHFEETTAPVGSVDRLSGRAKTVVDSIKLAHPGWTDAQVRQQAGNILEGELKADFDKKQIGAATDRALAESAGVKVPGAPGGAPPGTPPELIFPKAAKQPGAGGGAAAKPASGPAKVGGNTPPTSSVPAPGSDEDVINQFIGQILNPVPGSRGSKFSQLTMQNGRRLLQAKTGLSPTQLNAAITMKKGTAQALQNAVSLEGGFERLQNTLTSFGDLLIEAREKVNDTGVSVFNRWQRAGLNAVPGDPDVAKLDVAANAVARIYSQVLAGGYQSKAMPPVQSAEEAKQVIASYMQSGRIRGVVEQMKKEAAAEPEAMRRQQRTLFDELAKPLTEARPGGETPAPAAAPAATPKTPPAAGAKGKPKNADEEAAQWLANPH